MRPLSTRCNGEQTKSILMDTSALMCLWCWNCIIMSHMRQPTIDRMQTKSVHCADENVFVPFPSNRYFRWKKWIPLRLLSIKEMEREIHQVYSWTRFNTQSVYFRLLNEAQSERTFGFERKKNKTFSGHFLFASCTKSIHEKSASRKKNCRKKMNWIGTSRIKSQKIKIEVKTQEKILNLNAPWKISLFDKSKNMQSTIFSSRIYGFRK